MKLSIKIRINLLLLISISCFSQKVEQLSLTPSGTNGYLVKEFPGKTQAEIYEAVKNWMQYNIRNANFAKNSDIENDYLAFTVSNAGNIRYKKKGNRTWTMDINTEIRIKEDRVRIDIEIIRFNSMESNARPITISSGGINDVILFNGQGQVRKQYSSIKDDIELSLNDFANRIFNGIEGKQDRKDDDW